MKNLDNVQNRKHSAEALNALKECQQTDKKLFLNHIPKAELMKMELEAFVCSLVEPTYQINPEATRLEHCRCIVVRVGSMHWLWKRESL